MTTMRRLTLALLALLLTAGAQAQGTLGGGGGLWSSGPNPSRTSAGWSFGAYPILDCNTADCAAEIAKLYWTGNVFTIGMTAGTGSTRILDLGPGFVYLRITGSMYPNATDGNSLGNNSLFWKDLWISRGLRGGKSLSLVESSATTFVSIAAAQAASISGDIVYKIEAKDATNVQVISGRLRYTAVNESGTVACTISEIGTPTDNTPTGTLTVAWTCAEDSADVVSFKANAASSLTQTSLVISYRPDALDVATVTPGT
jgi:hypothetical protein